MIVQNTAKALYTAQTEQVSRSMQTVSSSAAQAGSGNYSGTDRLDISKPAEFLSKMAELQQTDPEKFHAVMKNNAGQLRIAAQQMQAQTMNDMLTNFAKQFDDAAEQSDRSDQQSDYLSTYSNLQNPLTNYGQQEQNTLGSLLASLQTQAKNDPQLQKVYDSIIQSVNSLDASDTNFGG